MTIGVSNISRSNNGSRYTLTRNDDSRIVVGHVEITGNIWNMRDSFDEPITVGSPRYNEFRTAVQHYLEWAEK